MLVALQRAASSLTRRSDATWLAGLATGLGLTLGAAYGPPGYGEVLVYLGLLVRCGLYLWAGDAQRDHGGEVLTRLVTMGIVAGLLELIVDWVLVHGVSHGRLVYLGAHDVVLLASPLWMPAAWACVITELGYPALRLFGALQHHRPPRTALVLASLTIAVGAAVTVGFYEYFAYRAGWWKYEPARVMIGSFCAVYIPLGEAFMFLAVLPLTGRLFTADRGRRAAVIENGALFALAIGAGYALAYLLLEAGRPL